jgi:hypothetical protein
METTQEQDLRTRLHTAAEAAPSGDAVRAVHSARHALKVRRRKVAAVVASGVAVVSVIAVVAATGLVTGMVDGGRAGPVVASTPTKSSAQPEQINNSNHPDDPLLRALELQLKGFDEYVEVYRDSCLSMVMVATQPGQRASDELRETAAEVIRREREAGRDGAAIMFLDIPFYRGIDYAEGRTKFTLARLIRVAADLRDPTTWPRNLRDDLGPKPRAVVVPGLGYVYLEVAHATAELRRRVKDRHPGGIVWVRRGEPGESNIVSPCGPMPALAELPKKPPTLPLPTK